MPQWVVQLSQCLSGPHITVPQWCNWHSALKWSNWHSALSGPTVTVTQRSNCHSDSVVQLSVPQWSNWQRLSGPIDTVPHWSNWQCLSCPIYTVPQWSKWVSSSVVQLEQCLLKWSNWDNSTERTMKRQSTAVSVYGCNYEEVTASQHPITNCKMPSNKALNFLWLPGQLCNDWLYNH